MLDKDYAKNHLIRHTDDLICLLKKLDFAEIQFKKGKIECLEDEFCGKNISINTGSLQCIYGDIGIGDIYDLLGTTRGLSFVQAVQTVYDILDLNNYNKKLNKEDDDFDDLFEQHDYLDKDFDDLFD
jgi:hypothetical protein